MTLKRVLVLVVGIAGFLPVAAPFPRLAAQGTLEIPDLTTSPGAALDVPILLSHKDEVQGYTTSVTYDNLIFSLTAITFEDLDVALLLAPDTVEFFFTQIDDAYDPEFGFGTVSAVFDTLFPFDGQTLPAGDQQSIVRMSFTSVGDEGLVGTCTMVKLTNGIGNPQPFNNLITVNGMSVFPDRVDGEVCFEGSAFIRGDADGDGVFNGLLDSLLILNFQFAGGRAPGCMEAAEVDGDSTFNGLLDGLYGLQHQFSGGPPPTAPYPACGTDADAQNSLGCGTAPPGCQP